MARLLLLVRLGGDRFIFSHGFGILLIGQLETILDGEKLMRGFVLTLSRVRRLFGQTLQATTIYLDLPQNTSITFVPIK